MDKLLQNNLEEATTDLGFCKTTNTKLIQNQEIDGETVPVEGIAPSTMATLLKSTYKTPGEITITHSGETLNGVVQNYNASTISPESIALSESTKTLDLNGTTEFILTTTITPSNAIKDTTLTWESNKPTIASVKDGKVTALAVGIANIKVSTANRKEATCVVTVIDTTSTEDE